MPSTATTSTPRAYLNDVSRTRAQRALLVAIDDRVGSPTFGQPVCKSVLDGSDTACLPANIFSFGELTPRPSPTSARPASSRRRRKSRSSTRRSTATWASAFRGRPTHVGGVRRRVPLYAVSIHRRTTCSSRAICSAKAARRPTSTVTTTCGKPSAKSRSRWCRITPWVKLLEFNGGYRISDYDTATGITHTYKYAGSWMPTDDVRFRASFQRAVRAPNVIELFTPATQGLFGGTDPCSLTEQQRAGRTSTTPPSAPTPA